MQIASGTVMHAGSLYVCAQVELCLCKVTLGLAGQIDIFTRVVLLQIARLPKENGSRGRTVFITQGALPSVVAYEG